MILPRMSAALLSMSFLGSAYASAQLHAGTSLDQWVVICGAVNGAAAVFQAPAEELSLHRRMAQTHMSRYAAENGMSLLEFEPLFERGQAEGRRIVSARDSLFGPRKTDLLAGFHNDTQISYTEVRRALSL